jgi:hypothetical protein
MGGLIARAIAASLPPYIAYANNTNFGQGFIHKMITLDTPHLGSELANNLAVTGPQCKALFAAKGLPVAGAISDLQTTSPLISSLKIPHGHPIMTHAVASTATAPQASSVEQTLAKANLVATEAAMLLPPPLGPIVLAYSPCLHLLTKSGFTSPGSFQATFGGNSDLIVGVTSEAAVGLQAGGFSIPTTSEFSFIHAVDPALFKVGPAVTSTNIINGEIAGVQTVIPGLIKSLLSAPVAGLLSQFEPILP